MFKDNRLVAVRILIYIFFFTCNVDRAVGVGTNQISFEFEVLSILHVMSTGCSNQSNLSFKVF